MKELRRHLIALVVSLAVLAGIEVVVRLTLPHVSTLDLFVISRLQQAGFTDRENVTIFEGDPLLFWRARPNLDEVVWDFTVVSTNDEGIRHVGPIEPKREGSLRIVTLGDSVTFGYRVPVVFPKRPKDYNHDALPYPLAMERDLRAKNPGRDIEVIDLAVPGYTSHQGLAWLRRDIERLEPDLVIACFGWNDINLRSSTDRETMKMDPYLVTLRRIGSASQAISHAVNWWRSRSTARTEAFAGSVMRVPTEQYVENFLEIAKVARAQGASILVLGPVYRGFDDNPKESERVTQHRDALRSAMQAAEIPYLEIPELLESNRANNAMLFGEPIHPNYQGHQLMEQRLLEFLSSHGMLSGLSLPDLPSK